MLEHKPVKRPGWPEEQPPGRLHQEPDWLVYAVIIALIVAIFIAALALLGPQTTGLFNQVNNNL